MTSGLGDLITMGKGHANQKENGYEKKLSHQMKSSGIKMSKDAGNRQFQRSFQSKWSRSVSENKGEMIWQQAKRETRRARKGIWR
jgi:hypothetical protein